MCSSDVTPCWYGKLQFNDLSVSKTEIQRLDSLCRMGPCSFYTRFCGTLSRVVDPAPISSTYLTSIGPPLCQHCSSLFQDLSDRIRLHWRRWRTVFRFPLPRAGKQQKAAECKGHTEGQQNSMWKWPHRRVHGKAQSCCCRGHKIISETSVLSVPSCSDNCEGLMMAYSSSVL